MIFIVILQKLYQPWREYCRTDIRHFTHTVVCGVYRINFGTVHFILVYLLALCLCVQLCHRSATVAWDEEVARTESADAKLEDAKNTFEASLVKRTKDDFGLVRAKERSRKALLLALRIGRMCKSIESCS
jgi:hypothetical protein